jgi:hypothetical protein
VNGEFVVCVVRERFQHIGASVDVDSFRFLLIDTAIRFPRFDSRESLLPNAHVKAPAADEAAQQHVPALQLRGRSYVKGQIAYSFAVQNSAFSFSCSAPGRHPVAVSPKCGLLLPHGQLVRMRTFF